MTYITELQIQKFAIELLENQATNTSMPSRLSNNPQSEEKERLIGLYIQKEAKFLVSKAIVGQPPSPANYTGVNGHE
jgi:hypothetical protein